ncbi:MAG TPA: NUDIX hydrolase [Firmicutes bacterium]|nr:NUDIX hydrolase [Bacillota bacterium]
MGDEAQRNGWREEVTVAREEIFRGALLAVRREQVRLPDGRRATREIVAHAPAVAILAVDGEDRVLLVRQFRKPLEEALWEVPAGKVEPGEDPQECARRELAEEAGVTAERWSLVGRIATTPGFCDEVIHLFRAEGLHPVAGVEADPDEALEVKAVPWTEVLGMVERGELWDAKSLCLVLGEAVRRGRR